jgi:flagellar M-ring protein FliF
VAAIVHLVASSVPELAASDVTLVDQAGTLLNSPDENAEQAASTRQFEYTRKLEESYQRRIIELLEPMIGAGPGACDRHRGSGFHGDRGDARELRSAKDRGAQRADEQRARARAATAPKAFPARSAISRRAPPARRSIPGAATPGIPRPAGAQARPPSQSSERSAARAISRSTARCPTSSSRWAY